MLNDTQKEIIRVFAESGMNRTEASRRMFRHYNTIYHQLIRIKEKTELNPWDFFDLHELLRMAGGADYVDVVRCKDCKNYNQNPYGEENEKWCMCWADWIPTEPDDFCSYGERRDK